MSTFLHMAQRRTYHERKAVLEPLDMRLKVTPACERVAFEHLNRYALQVEWSAYCYARPEHKENVWGDLHKRLAEDVYGDFRGLLQDLKFALYEHDMEKALLLVNRLFEETLP